jgi:predicted dehydrogenase
MMTTLRAAIIGCGNIGSAYTAVAQRPGVYSHAHAYAEHADVELVAVSDPDAAKAQACAERWGVAGVFADHGEMLRQAQPDIVSICSPNDTHVAIGLDVIAHASVRGLICEKPLSLDSSGAGRLAETAASAGKPLLVNYSRRFDAGYQELRTRIAAGAMGDIQAVTGLYGKGLFHNGTHWLDLVRFLFGEPRWVQGYPSGFAFDADETLSLTLGLAGGAIATLQGTDHNALTVFEMDVVGTAGRVRLDDGGRAISYYDVRDGGFLAGARTFEAEPRLRLDVLADALPNAIANLVNHLDGGEALRCTGDDGVAAVRLAEAVRSSAATGERVALS